MSPPGRAADLARRLGLLLLCVALGALAWPARPDLHFPHVIDGLERWGPVLLAALALGLCSYRDWFQRSAALTAGECVKLQFLSEHGGLGYLFLYVLPLMLLANAFLVLGAASVRELRQGLRD